MSKVPAESERNFMGIREVADMLGVCYATVRDNIVPNVEHMKVGRRILLDTESVQKYLHDLRRKAARV